MPYDAEHHHQRSIRLAGYDYNRHGVYFVTICVQGRESVFGEIRAGVMHSNAWGDEIAKGWQTLSERFPYAHVDAFVVMPNHCHALIVIVDDASTNSTGQGDRPALGKVPRLGQVVGYFKYRTAKEINLRRGAPGASRKSSRQPRISASPT